MRYFILFLFISTISQVFTAEVFAKTLAKTLDWQDMRDWSVFCNDKRYCVALTSGKSDKGDKITFKLERSYKERSNIFVTTKPDGYLLKKGMHVSVSVTGHDYRFFGDVQKVYKGNEMAFSEPFNARSITKLREGRFADISIDYGGSIGKITYSVSLQGVSSVLATMDIIQGRLDREDAAVIRGGEAASLTSHHDFSAASAPEKTETTAKAPRDPEENINYSADRAENIEEAALGETSVTYNVNEVNGQILRIGVKTLECPLGDAVDAFGIQSINLEPGLFLHLVPCQMADFNVPYYAVLESANGYDLIEFQHSSIEEGSDPSFLINAAWDKKQNALTAYQYYSPNQDCGSHAKHIPALEEQKFYLSEFRLKEDCDGHVTPPETYPLEWNGEGD